MSPTVADIISALPEDADVIVERTGDDQLRDIFERVSRRPVPVGALGRLWTLGGLQAKIGLAWLAYWTRGWFQGADRRETARAEAYLAVAIRTFETMAYLRGAIMKLGQTVANFPEIVPDEFVDTLSRFHFQAPPMHFSLLRAQVESELGQDIEDVFEYFDTEAFAAASLGQVHRARLKSGEPVAVKVQYPGIARSIRSDFRNLNALLLPLRLGSAWSNLQRQFDEVRRVLTAETDYVKEAENLRRARAQFHEDDGIVVPRVYDEYSTRRLLTMEMIEGKNFDQYLASHPTQESRNAYGELISRAMCRLYYGSRTLYADPHPGNFLFLQDGRLGLVDFGCIRTFNDEEWDYLRHADLSIGGDREKVVAHLRRGMELSEKEWSDPRVQELGVQFCAWCWQAAAVDREFDFGDEAHFRRGVELAREFSRVCQPRQTPVNVFILRWHFASASVLYRLRTKFNLYRLTMEERPLTGWPPRVSSV